MNTLHLGLRRFWLPALLAIVLPWAAQAQVTRDWIRVTPGTYGDMVAMDKANNVIVEEVQPAIHLARHERHDIVAINSALKHLQRRTCNRCSLC